MTMRTTALWDFGLEPLRARRHPRPGPEVGWAPEVDDLVWNPTPLPYPVTTGYDLPPWYEGLDYDGAHICECHDQRAIDAATDACGSRTELGSHGGVWEWGWGVDDSGNCRPLFRCMDGTTSDDFVLPTRSPCLESLADGLPAPRRCAPPPSTFERCVQLSHLEGSNFKKDLHDFTENVEGAALADALIAIEFIDPDGLADEDGRTMLATAMALLKSNKALVEWALCMTSGWVDPCLLDILFLDEHPRMVFSDECTPGVGFKGLPWPKKHITVCTNNGGWRDRLQGWRNNQPPAEEGTCESDLAATNRLAIAAGLAATLAHEYSHACGHSAYDFSEGIFDWAEAHREEWEADHSGYGGGGGPDTDIIAGVAEVIAGWIEGDCVESYLLQQTMLWILTKRYPVIQNSNCFKDSSFDDLDLLYFKNSPNSWKMAESSKCKSDCSIGASE